MDREPEQKLDGKDKIILFLLAVMFVWLCLDVKQDRKYLGPEYSGQSHVDGRP